MTDGRPHILDVLPEDLAEWFRNEGQPAYRVGQVLDWVCAKLADSFGAMRNLPGPLRQRLAECFAITGPQEIARRVSADGDTGKLLLELSDGARIECVWMTSRRRRTFCVSSQAGCPLGCRFCATGAAGFTRNLRPAEILAQVVALSRATGAPRNVVFMGMGEPLLNCEAVFPALEALADKRSFGISPRHLTVSTAGIPFGIRELAASSVPPNLAFSLNSPFDEQRADLMPISRRYPLADIIEACDEYAAATGRRILIEYVLIGGVNTGTEAARAVGQIARRLRAAVNLIPFNTVPGCGLHPPTQDEVAAFRGTLAAKGIAVTQRYRRGRDIDAACGQLSGHEGRPAAGA